eukprot:TRINITY_DN18788_c0_g1_i1.p1 TRINITY_DN18788_c0_g1~~TRINITY_DN18788_c0_g1_i1.p1  ORF type:complete len:536 (+),score=39.64 TRINITY_DN18788_c0_g1_i1:106-1713(+)
MSSQYSRANWFFWSDIEKDSVLSYKDVGEVWGNSTLIERMLRPVMQMIANTVPDTIAPNVLTLAGLVTLLHGAYISHKHSESFPVATAVLCAILVTAYYVFDAIDGLHAVRIRNRSNIGLLLVSAVNSCAPVMLTVILCRTVLGITELSTIWYAIQGIQLFFLAIRVREMHGTSRHMVGWFIPGPAALVPLFPLLCLTKAAVYAISVDTSDRLLQLWWSWVAIVVGYVEKLPFCEDVRQNINQFDSTFVHDGFLTFYTMMLIAVVLGCFMSTTKPTYKQTQKRLLICLAYRIVPAFMLQLGLVAEVSISSILVDGFFLAVLMTDMTVSKFAGRSLHPWIIIFCMISVLDFFIEFALFIFYFLSIFYDLCEHSKNPLFTVMRNVYVDGIYDLCHIGHMRMFEASARFGNALFVGVVNDEDATPYKRRPIMTAEERAVEVGACKYVTKVIPNAPCNGLTKEFIEEHNIHLVVCGEEYFNKSDDIYYKVPREMGILRCAPRTGGMSTSELIARITEADQAALVAKDKVNGSSAVPDVR